MGRLCPGQKIMEMNHDAVGIDEDDGVGRRFKARLPAVGKIESGLVAGAAKCARGNAASASGDEPMHLAGEDMADVAVALQDFMEGIGIGKPHPVEFRHVNPGRRMVHEQEGRQVAGLLQPTVQPAEPRLTKPACYIPRIQRVEQDQATLRRIDNALDEALFGCHVREDTQEHVAVIVVVQHQPMGRQQSGQPLPQCAIGSAFAVIGKVTGNYDKLGVGVVRIDVGEAAPASTEGADPNSVPPAGTRWRSLI
jgi:hypothetical protein